MPVPIAVHQLYAKPCDQVQKNNEVSSGQRAGDEDCHPFARDVAPVCLGLPSPRDLRGEHGVSRTGDLAVTIKAFFSPRGFVSRQPDVPAEMPEVPFLTILQHEDDVPTDKELALTDKVLCSPKDLVSMKPVEPAEIAEVPFPDDLSDTNELSNDAELASTANLMTGPRAPATTQPDVRAEEEEEGSARYGLQGARFDAAAQSGPPENNELRHSADAPVEAPERLPADVQHVIQVRSEVQTGQRQGRVASPAPAANPPLVMSARREIGLLLPDCAVMMIVFSTAGLVVMIVSMAIEELVMADQL